MEVGRSGERAPATITPFFWFMRMERTQNSHWVRKTNMSISLFLRYWLARLSNLQRMHVGVNVINVTTIVTESVSAILDEVTQQLWGSPAQNVALKDEQRIAITCQMLNKQFIRQALAKVWCVNTLAFLSHPNKIVDQVCLLSKFSRFLVSSKTSLKKQKVFE